MTVNMPETADTDPERALVLSYARIDARAGLAALLALDDRLNGIVARAREPVIGAMRLTWWADALEKLDSAPAPAEPLLRALAADVLPRGLTGAALAGMIDGWERLLEPDGLDLAAHAAERGGRLFAGAARLLGGADARVERVGEGWALAALARERPAAAARAMAAERLAGAWARAWPRALRPLGAMGLLARFDLAGEAAPGSPRRVARLLAHRLTGR